MNIVPRRALALLAVIVVCFCFWGDARAQVLHERVVVGPGKDIRCANGVCWREGHAADGAAAIVADGELLPAPSAGAQPAPDEPVYTAAPERAAPEHSATTDDAVPGGTPERRARVEMDRQTGPEPPGTRLYHEPFNPAIFPFKRMTALDAVEADESLVLAERSEGRRRLHVLGAERREGGRDAFWGSIVVDFEPGRWVPLPSVAPDAHILAARVEPTIELTFARDGADNQYVMSTSGGRHRLVWLTDAPQTYFAGSVPSTLTLGDEPRLPQAVPSVIKRRAARVIARLGLEARPSARLWSTLDGLVAWFRAFSSGEPPTHTDSLYLDLALSQKGSCRHRSYAFVITALALGIPARYVENELHVFVEVLVPGVGWRRINLGGALVDEQVAGADGKVPYRPKGDDPFPQPPEFGRQGDAVPPAPKALTEAARASSGGNGSSGGGGNGGGGHGGGARTRVDLDKLDAEAAPGTPGARPTRATVATAVHVNLAARDAFRGDRVEVAGSVAADDGKPGGLPVEIYLDATGGALRVGDTTAQPDGTFHVSIEVPRDLPLGDHRVVARTPGDATRKPSRSR